MQITLLFDDKGSAIKFQDFLTTWYIDNSMVVKSTDVSVKKELEVTHVEESKLSRVFISDSDFDESDFHIQSPGEFLGHSSNCAMS